MSGYWNCDNDGKLSPIHENVQEVGELLSGNLWEVYGSRVYAAISRQHRSEVGRAAEQVRWDAKERALYLYINQTA